MATTAQDDGPGPPAAGVGVPRASLGVVGTTAATKAAPKAKGGLGLSWWELVLHAAALYFIASAAVGLTGSAQRQGQRQGGRNSTVTGAQRQRRSPAQHHDVLPEGSLLDLRVFVSEHSTFSFVRDAPASEDNVGLGPGPVWLLEGLRYAGDADELHELQLNVSIPTHLRLLASPAAQQEARHPNIYAHVFFTVPGEWPLLQEHYSDPHILGVGVGVDGSTNTSTGTSVSDFNSATVLYRSFPLLRHRRRKVVPRLLKLGGSGIGTGVNSAAAAARAAEASAQRAREAGHGAEAPPVMPFFVPSLALSLVTGAPRSWQPGQVPPAIRKHLHFLPQELVERGRGVTEGQEVEAGTGTRALAPSRFQPVVYRDDFWVTSGMLRELNRTMAPACEEEEQTAEWEGAVVEPDMSLPLTLSYRPVGFWRWSMQTQLEEQWRTGQGQGVSGKRTATDAASLLNASLGGNASAVSEQLQDLLQAGGGLHSETETDMIRELLLDTPPWLLVVTGVVSLLHSVFDVLAFRNDINVRYR